MLFQASRWLRYFAAYHCFILYTFSFEIIPYASSDSLSLHLSPFLIQPIVRLNQIIRKIYSFLWCTSHCCVYLCKPTIIPAFRQIVCLYHFFLYALPIHSLKFTHFFHIFFWAYRLNHSTLLYIRPPYNYSFFYSRKLFTFWNLSWDFLGLFFVGMEAMVGNLGVQCPLSQMRKGKWSVRVSSEN